MPDARRAEHEALLKSGKRALALMDAHLQASDWLAGGRLTMADVSLFAYTHVADEGGFDLTPFTGITAWISRLKSHPNFAPMEAH